MPSNKKKRQLRREKRLRALLRKAEVQTERDTSTLVARDPPQLPPSLPSYTATLNGLPAMPDTSGFRRLDKLKGAHRTLWRMGMTLLIETWLSAGPAWPDNLEGKLPFPLFNLLSTHQRVRLLREVAVGLLCAETPLPTESVWHYAAYFAPLHFVLYNLLRYELDSALDPSASPAEGTKTSKWRRTPLVQMAMREHLRQKRLPLEETTTRVLLKEIMKSPLGSQKQLSKWKKSITNNSLNVVHAGSEEHQFWRKLVLSFLSEHAGQNHGDIELPNASVANFSVWESIFGLIGFSSILQDDIYMELVFGVPRNAGCTALDHLIQKVSNRSHTRFEKTWKVADSVFDLRCLILLMEEKDGCARFGYEDDESAFLGHLDLLQNNDGKRRFCCSIFAQSVSRENDPGSPITFDLEGTDFSTWSWAHLWHSEMQFNSSDYDSPAARINALESISAKVSSHRENIGFIKIIWESSLCMFCCTDLTCESVRPSWYMLFRRSAFFFCQDVECGMNESEHGIELYSCGGCGVVSYCSKECQINDKAKHKKICKKLKHIVEKGKGACSELLTEGVILET